jgi:hypothetical protein
MQTHRRMRRLRIQRLGRLALLGLALTTLAGCYVAPGPNDAAPYPGQPYYHYYGYGAGPGYLYHR